MPRRSPSPAWEDDGEDDDTLGVPPRATLAKEFERIGKAEGKKLFLPVKGGKESDEVAAEPKKGPKVATSGLKSDETL